MKDIFKVGFVPMFQSKSPNDVNITTLDTNLVTEENITALDTNSVPEGYVDLGLPSGTLWATCNLGATTETECGKYFQWGAIEGYERVEAETHSYWNTAPFNNGTDGFDAVFFNKHKSEWFDGNVLKPEYDAVYKATNGLAHIPTWEQVDELINKTANEWVTNYNDTGVNGMKFISKTDPHKYLFIPAAGIIGNGKRYGLGTDGYIYTNNLYPAYPSYAYYLYFCQFYTHPMANGNRYCGRPIRGVIG